MPIDLDKIETVEIKMWKCSCCGKDVTYYDELENEVYTLGNHFDIERSIKELFIEDNNIEEHLEGRNEKMNRMVCEKCFNKILSESPTLRKTFECKIDGEIQILY
jgi:hypothetical protein